MFTTVRYRVSENIKIRYTRLAHQSDRIWNHQRYRTVIFFNGNFKSEFTTGTKKTILILKLCGPVKLTVRENCIQCLFFFFQKHKLNFFGNSVCHTDLLRKYEFISPLFFQYSQSAIHDCAGAHLRFAAPFFVARRATNYVTCPVLVIILLKLSVVSQLLHFKNNRHFKNLRVRYKL